MSGRIDGIAFIEAVENGNDELALEYLKQLKAMRRYNLHVHNLILNLALDFAKQNDNLFMASEIKSTMEIIDLHEKIHSGQLYAGMWRRHQKDTTSERSSTARKNVRTRNLVI